MFEFDGQAAKIRSLTIKNTYGDRSLVEFNAVVAADDALFAQLGPATAFVRSDVETWEEIEAEWQEEHDAAVAKRDAERERLEAEWKKEVDRCKDKGVRPPEPPLPPALDAPKPPDAVSSKRRLDFKSGFVNAVLVAQRPPDGEEPAEFLAAFRGDVKGAPVVEVHGSNVSLSVRIARKVRAQDREQLADIVGSWLYLYDSQVALLATPPTKRRPAGDGDAAPGAAATGDSAQAPPEPTVNTASLLGQLEAYWSDGWADVLVEELAGEEAAREPVRLLDRVFDVARVTRKKHLAPVKLDDGDDLMVPGIASKADLDDPKPASPKDDDQAALPLDGQAEAEQEPARATRPPVPGSLGQALEVLQSHWNEDDTFTAMTAAQVAELLGADDPSEVQVRLQLLAALGTVAVTRGSDGLEYAAVEGGTDG